MCDIVSPEIDQYCEAHSASLPGLLEELIRETGEVFGARALMLSGRIEGAFLQTLVAATGARRVLEVGTFTGFSALMMAAALPADGELVTLELSEEHAATARRYFERSGYGDRITLIEGPALDRLKTVPGPFDLAFIDADKPNYSSYYDAVLPLMSERGLIAVDNVLWSGRVLDPQDGDAKAIAAFNDKVARDDRVVPVMLSVRDGITLIRRAGT
jgi:caffeoyl-CoA O-methyltransferase